MSVSSLLMVLAAYLALISGSPLSEDDSAGPRGSFTIRQIAGSKTPKIGPAERIRTLKKYGGYVPQRVRLAATSAKQVASATQSGSVGANPEAYDQEYLCPVSIGTPPQTLMLDFDTGSADLWVFSGRLPSDQLKKHAYYHIVNSNTKKLSPGATWDITYGDQSGAKGIVFTDKVVVGPVTATAQAVEAATYVSSGFVSDTHSSGLLGLAASSLNTVSPNKATTFFDTVKGTLPSPLFTSNLKHGAPGTYGFGFINSSEYIGSIAYTPVTFANGWWEFKVATYKVGDVTYSAPLDVIADTGTTLIYMPDIVLSRYYAQVLGASNSDVYGGWVFPCSASLPTFSINIGGNTFTVPAQCINYSPMNSRICYGGLQSSSSIGFEILGDIFLKTFYTVWDAGNSRIGFAAHL